MPSRLAMQTNKVASVASNNRPPLARGESQDGRILCSAAPCFLHCQHIMTELTQLKDDGVVKIFVRE
jgi:hypothetical protein